MPPEEVTFNDESAPRAPIRPREPKGLYKLVIDLGFARTEEGAQAALFFFTIIFLAVAIFYPVLFGPKF